MAVVTQKSVMLAAGGTGGHLFPALALAQELGRRSIAVDLVTDMRGDRYGANFPARAIYRVPSATLARRSVVAATGTAWMLTRGVTAAFRLLGQVKRARSSASAAIRHSAARCSVSAPHPDRSHEQNAVLGRANRMGQARQARLPHLRAHEIPGGRRGPVPSDRQSIRDEVIDWATQSYRAPSSHGPFSLLVFGGSQGARFFSDALPPALALLPPQLRASLFVVQQCREEDLARVEEAYKDSGVRAHLATFFANLPEEMAKCHLVIGRAGASTVAELAVMGRPAILVPLPHAIDNDQLGNAKHLAESGGAWCIEQQQLTPDRLAEAISRLLTSPEALGQAAAAIKRHGRPTP